MPKGWRFYHGAYYYRVPAAARHLWDHKAQFRLGTTLAEAHTTYGKRAGEPTDKIRTVGDLLDRYALKVVPMYQTPTTRTNKAFHLKKLRSVFAAVPIAGFKPAYVYKYVEARGKRRVSAHREIETLSHAFTKLVEWGEIDRHPFKGEVRLEGEPSRTRYIEDWEIVEMLALPAVRKKGSVLAIQAYIRLKLLTGLARSDLLRLRAGEHLRDDGIHVTRHKTATTTGKTTIYEYAAVPERREAVEQARAVRQVLSPFLFCKRDGKGYFNEETGECHGWDSMWQHFVERVLERGTITKRFTEHDLRAKVGSDAASLEKARALLQHADSRTTARVYRRKPERV